MNILIILGVSLVNSFLSLLFERLIILSGWTRGNTVGVVIVTFCFTTLTQLVDFNQSQLIVAFLIIFGAPIGANRYDLMKTLDKGRWWWKLESE
ncbi:MAG: hypothetical protein GY755_16150 [Chloroflexi bacterium]|nr:hypothetical protein [Chloroflexota bacterium]